MPTQHHGRKGGGGGKRSFALAIKKIGSSSPASLTQFLFSLLLVKVVERKENRSEKGKKVPTKFNLLL